MYRYVHHQAKRLTLTYLSNTYRDHALQASLVDGKHGFIQCSPNTSHQDRWKPSSVGCVLLQQGLESFAVIAHLPNALLALSCPMEQHAQPTYLWWVLVNKQHRVHEHSTDQFLFSSLLFFFSSFKLSPGPKIYYFVTLSKCVHSAVLQKCEFSSIPNTCVYSSIPNVCILQPNIKGYNQNGLPNNKPCILILLLFALV